MLLLRKRRYRSRKAIKFAFLELLPLKKYMTPRDMKLRRTCLGFRKENKCMHIGTVTFAVENTFCNQILDIVCGFDVGVGLFRSENE